MGNEDEKNWRSCAFWATSWVVCQHGVHHESPDHSDEDVKNYLVELKAEIEPLANSMQKVHGDEVQGIVSGSSSTPVRSQAIYSDCVFFFFLSQIDHQRLKVPFQTRRQQPHHDVMKILSSSSYHYVIRRTPYAV